MVSYTTAWCQGHTSLKCVVLLHGLFLPTRQSINLNQLCPWCCVKPINLYDARLLVDNLTAPGSQCVNLGPHCCPQHTYIIQCGARPMNPYGKHTFYAWFVSTREPVELFSNLNLHVSLSYIRKWEFHWFYTGQQIFTFLLTSVGISPNPFKCYYFALMKFTGLLLVTLAAEVGPYNNRRNEPKGGQRSHYVVS